jgi:L-rhamnose mutarotase
MNATIAHRENVAIAYRENVAVAYRKNDVLNNMNNLLFAMTHYNCLETEMRQLKAHQNLQMNVAITYRENGVLSNMNSLLFAMMHYNCLERKMHQPRDDGIVEKWTQYVDSVARKCGSRNDRQTRRTITRNFLRVARMAKFYCRIFLQHCKSGSSLTNKKSSAVKFRDQIRMYNSVLAFTSFNAKIDESVTGRAKLYSFRIQGDLYHKIGSLCPAEGQRP